MQYGVRMPEKDWNGVLIVGECFNETDERSHKAFSDRSTNGTETFKVLREAGIDPHACMFTNLVNLRPPNGQIHKYLFSTEVAKKVNAPLFRGLYITPELLDGLNKLETLIEETQPRVIVAMGNFPLWALSEEDWSVSNGTGLEKGYKVPTGIARFRGSQLLCRYNDIPLLPVFPTMMVMKNWPWRYLLVHDLRARMPKALAGEWSEPMRNYIIRPSFEQTMDTLMQLLMRAELSQRPILLACDIETVASYLECVGLAWSKADAICIPIMWSETKEGYWNAEEEIQIMMLLGKVLSHPMIEVVGQNFFYDYQYFWYYYGIRSNYKQDTMLAHHVCYPGTTMGLDYLSSLYCNFHRYWKDDGKEASKNHNDEQRWIYNCRDCVVTYEVMEELWKLLEHYGMWDQYAIQMTRAQSVLPMMMRGVAIDKKRRGEEQLVHMQTAQSYEAMIDDMLPESVWRRDPKKTLWFRSNLQLAEIFYDELGIAEVINRKTGSRTVDDEALSKIALREPILTPLTTAIQQYRSLDTFGQFINMKVSRDQRMRATFSPTTETFRYRSSADVFGYGRNLQNLPKGNEEE